MKNRLLLGLTCQDLRQAQNVSSPLWQFTWNSYAESSEKYMEVALAELYLEC